jgi:alginate O-acetyltransferase complex protein AlgI
VFLVSGVWHGANWTFVVWGAIHAVLYFVERAIKPISSKLNRSNRVVRTSFQITSVLLTFHAVLLAWVFFRAESLSDATRILGKIGTDLGGKLYIGSSMMEFALSVLLIAFLCTMQLLQYFRIAPFYGSRGKWPWVWSWAGTLGLALAILLLGKSNSDFIYFQF